MQINPTSSDFAGRRYLLNIAAFYQQKPVLKIYLEIFLSIITVIFLIAFAIKPTAVTIAGLFTKIQTEQETSDGLDTKIKNLGIAQSLYNNNQDAINLMNDGVPDNPNVGSYVRQFEGMIKKEGLTAERITADSSLLVATTSGSIKVTTQVTGTYNSLESFLKDSELMRRPSFASKIDFLHSGTDKGDSLDMILTSQAPYE